MSLADLSRPAESPASDVPPEWREKVWPGFEQSVIELVSRGCECLKADPTRKPSWKERDFSWALHRHLERLCYQGDLSYSPRYDQHVLSDSGFAAGESPLSSPILDLAVRWNKDIPEIYFGVEAKILVESRVGSYKPWDSVNEYVAQGMKRYVDGEYGLGLPRAAMVGYVLLGTPDVLAEKINAQIQSLPLAFSQLLQREDRPPPPDAWYESNHPRGSVQTPIQICHLFILFPTTIQPGSANGGPA